ncbi:MAG: Na/Pi symporter, partial [Planctomycetes bacterium]|nr:Na/Pi symporter [Planctomycetota bacterium]
IIRTLVLSRMARLVDRFLFRTTAHAMILGLVLTTVVQSSSVTTSLIVPLAGAGLLTLHQVFPCTLGANVGTTVTAFLAASAAASTGVGSVAPLGVVVALMHLVFNSFGIAIFLPLRRIPIAIAEGCAGYVATSRRRTVLTLTGVAAGFVLLVLITFL